MLRRQFTTVLCLACADLFGLICALLAGVAFRKTVLGALFPNFFNSDVFLRKDYLFLVVISLGTFAYEGLYTKRRTNWEEMRYILRGICVSFVLFLALLTVIKQGAEVSRPAIAVACLLSPWVLLVSRLAAKRLMRRSTFWLRRVLLVGCNAEAFQFASRCRQFPELGYHLLGFLRVEGETADESGNCFGSVEELDSVVQQQGVDEIVIAIPSHSRLRQFEIMTSAEDLVPRVSVLPQLFDSDKLNVEIEKIDSFFLLSFQNNLMRRSNRLLKGVFEILIVLVTLPVWSPLLLVLSVAVRFSSPGPVFFRQTRIGRGGDPFSCFKFRTMVINADRQLADLMANNPLSRQQWEAEQKLKDDPRITPLGSLLRKTSLDELPQLFNILRGEMSLVGPRPIVESEVERYGEYFKYYRAVCPGLSGLWQVSGRNDTSYEQRVMLDTFYVRNWSLWLDFIILLRTVPAVLKKEGAY